MRTFIALKLPSDFITSISQIERDLSTSIRGNFVPENSLHLTLAFMGELKTNAQVSATQAALELATRNFAPISLHPEGLGIFGRPSDATLWMGISPTPALMHLAKNIRTELTIKGLPYDQVQFKPHITIACHAHVEPQQIKDYPMPDTVRATNVTIYRSDLLPHGAQYTPLHSVTL